MGWEVYYTVTKFTLHYNIIFTTSKMNFWLIVFLLGAVFVLTYNPKSRTLEKIVEVQPRQEQCEAERYQRLQFIGGDDACTQKGKTKMGAIISA